MAMLLLGGSLAVAQTAEDRAPETSASPAPVRAPTAAAPQETTPLVPGGSETVRMAPIRTPEHGPAVSDSDTSSAVFDAPDQPGVRMMAPIPDSAPAPAASAAAPKGAVVAAKRRGFSGPVFLSPTDHANFTQAAAAADHGNWANARSFAGRISNEGAKRIIEWRYLLDENSGAPFEAIDRFLKDHGNWPRHDGMVIRAEKSMPATLSPKQVIDWYGSRAPLSGVGLVRLGEAYIDGGRGKEGNDLIRKAWAELDFNLAEENDLLRAHGDLFGPAEHKARLDHFLLRDDAAGARRQLARVDQDAQRIGQARMRLKASPAAAKATFLSLPESLRSDADFLFDAARAYRLRGQDDDAWSAALQAADRKGVVQLPDRWSNELTIAARNALQEGETDLAYRLAAKATGNTLDGTPDGQFLAGWIALRYLKKPQQALAHFEAFAKGVTMPISVARAYYWQGRTEEELNHPVEAITHYRKAGEYPATFYGQLALARINETPVLKIRAPVLINARDAERNFEADDRIQAIKIFGEYGDRGNARLFAIRVANDPPDAKHLELLSKLILSFGDQAMSVRVAKIGSYQNVILPTYLDPVISLPKAPKNVDPPEPALVLGISRQESEFDTGAVSSAGARGLMQLMPASARHAAVAAKIAYRPNDLTADPQYNLQLGMSVLSDYLARWEGSYVLAIASYNAGPGNVNKWVEAYGDPRDPGVDPVDWIEKIPFPETRNYVERVLENLQVYRNRLSERDERLGIVADLYRPVAPKMAVLKYHEPSIPPAPALVPIPVQSPRELALEAENTTPPDKQPASEAVIAQ
ncbi:MAG TPA: transglycosylase SLT domain-containing protein [Micropepsaceae bacterium]|nr:transglycosylase SLT domain-containing protein [Micropepsaceae bacterium]